MLEITLKGDKRRGAAYIIAIAVLALLAFMGTFLVRNTSAGYSQAAYSVYRTMATQLAEGAAEEAFVLVEQKLKDKGAKGGLPLLVRQAAESELPGMGDTGTLAKISITEDFNDMAPYVQQTKNLADYHLVRNEFEIDNIMVEIKDLRPIPNGPLDYFNNYYSPKDRGTIKFDNKYSRDWQCTIRVNVTVKMRAGGRRKQKYDYVVSRDAKIINMEPIARDYTFFSTLGLQWPSGVSDSGQLFRHMTRMMGKELDSTAPEKMAGRLFLWNLPFESRVYFHGPAVIPIENAGIVEDATDKDFRLGFYQPMTMNDTDELEITKIGPTFNLAYQYSHTYLGLGPFEGKIRAIYGLRSKNLDHMDDTADYNVILATVLDGIGSSDKDKHSTAIGGTLPVKSQGFLDSLGRVFQNLLTGYKKVSLYVGYAKHQKFFPGGPFSRTPWRFVSEERNASAEVDNPGHHIKPLPASGGKKFPEFPITLEHRWNKDDKDVEDSTRIYAGARLVDYRFASLLNTTSPYRETQLPEFGIYYYNLPVKGIWGKVWGFIKDVGQGLLDFSFSHINMLVDAAKSLWSRFRPPRLSVDGTETDVTNLFPSNFKFNYMGRVTRKFKNETDIPVTPENYWNLNGVYHFEDFQIEDNVVYTGTGTVVLDRYNEVRPPVIKGSVTSDRDADNFPMGHLNIFNYNPYSGSSESSSARYLVLDGTDSPVFLEASVFSYYGLKSLAGAGGNLTPEQMVAIGMDPSQPYGSTQAVAGGTPGTAWDVNVATRISDQCNVIFGNYVNAYTNLKEQGDDLWVFHNTTSPAYFKNFPGDPRPHSTDSVLLKADDNDIIQHFVDVHEFYMSPKLQHVSFKGAGSE
ncbi:MAG: hypothetical protein GX221_06265 [Candidatus Riflebacteria bacterium]|nr:hypothetical protein [Candidatus Riflebacteria bacterium]